jgi:hypothetical protein
MIDEKRTTERSNEIPTLIWGGTCGDPKTGISAITVLILTKMRRKY